MFTEDILEEFSGIKFSDAVYSKSKNCCSINFLYNPDLFELNDANRQKIKDKIVAKLGSNIEILLHFVKCVINENIIANYCFITLSNNFPALSTSIMSSDIKVSINGINVLVEIAVPEGLFDYVTEAKRNADVVEKLKENFVAEFSVEFSKKEAEDNIDIIKNNQEFHNSIQAVNLQSLFQLQEIESIIGKNDYDLAIDFSTIKQPINDVVICGNIKFFNKRFFNKKITKDNQINTVEKCYFNLNISLNNNSIYCTIFPSDKDIAKLEALAVGDSIAMKGKMQMFKESLSFTANSLCKCKIVECKPKIDYKPVNENYYTVFPKEYVDATQMNLFSFQTEVLPTLKGEFVVFDFETTGLEPTINEIIEIGAVKVKDGAITQTFSTFVKPSVPIPIVITDITSITDEMVADSPTINLVLPDFYKFCHGCTMVAYNIDFDFKFLKFASDKLLYNFDNKQIDAYSLARNKLKALKSYKLTSVAEHLNIELKDAHRGISDAIATAKVFLKLMS